MVNSLSISKQIVFVDSRVQDMSSLLAGLPRDIEVHLLDADRDGLTQMQEVLAGRSGLDAIHLLGHGSSASAQLGSTLLSSANLGAFQTQLGQIGQSLTADGDLLFYGCNVAQGDAGQAFIEQIAQMTNADVAASIDVTGAAALGGNWVLEAASGITEAVALDLQAWGSSLADTTPPVVQSAVFNADGTKITLNFNEALLDTPLVIDYFKVFNLVTYQRLEFNSAIVSGTTVVLSLKSPANMNNSTDVDYASVDAEISTTGIVKDLAGNAMHNIVFAVPVTAGGNAAPVPGTTGSVEINPGASLQATDLTKTNTSSSDNDGDTLTFTLTGTTIAAGSEESNPQLKGRVEVGTQGFSVTDGKVTVLGGSIKVYAEYVDSPTTWETDPTNQTWSQSGTNSYSMTGAADLDDNVIYSGEIGNPTWVSVAADGKVTGNVAPEFAEQIYYLSVSATGSNEVSKSFGITTGTATEVNDLPTASGAAQSVAEDATKTFAAADFNFADLDHSAGGSSASGAALNKVLIDSVPTHGTLTVGETTPTAVSAGDEILLADISTLKYTPSDDYNGSDSFTYFVHDGLAFSTAKSTMALTVTSVPDKPSITGAETRPNTKTTTGLVISRAEVDHEEVGYFKITDITNGTLYQNDGSTPIENGSFITYAQGQLGLKFMPTPDSALSGNVTIQASNTADNDGLGGDPVSATILVNNPPTSTSDSATTLEDTAIVLTADDFGTYADFEKDPFNSVKITTLPDTGTLEYDAAGSDTWAAVTQDQVITVEDIGLKKLRFTPGTDLNGATQVRLGFKVNDSFSFSNSAYTLSFDVTAVSDAPAGTNATLTLAEDTTHVLKAANFGFTDPKDDVSKTANELASVTITTLPSAGTLTLDGVAVKAEDVVLLADITDGKLVFTPVTNVNATGYDSFTFQVKDDGLLDDGGANLDLSPNTITFDVTPVNDAPVLLKGVPLLTTIDENATTGNLVSDLLAGTEGGASSGDTTGRTDIDATTNNGPNAPEKADQGMAVFAVNNAATAGGGTWQYQVGSTGGWTAFDFTGNNAGKGLMLAATDSVRFLPDTENGTTATLQYYAWDGASGSAGAYADVGDSDRGGNNAFSVSADTATITVSDVNDAPLLDLDGDNSSQASGNSSTSTASYTAKYLMRGDGVAITDTDITITDVDMVDKDQPDNLVSATVAITGGAFDNSFGINWEKLTANSNPTDSSLLREAAASITTPGSFGDITISGSGTASISISGKGTWADYQDIIRGITYQNTNPDGRAGARTITITVTDEHLTTPSGTAATSTTTATINNVWAPVVDLNGTTGTGVTKTATYTEGDDPLAIAASDATISDSNSDVTEMVVAISNPLDSDAETLSIPTSTADLLGLTVTGNGSTSLKLSGKLSPSDYSLALRSITYANSSGNPDTTQRDITITATDGTDTGVIGHSYIDVVSVNSAPVLAEAQLPGSGTSNDSNVNPMSTIEEDIADGVNPGSYVVNLIVEGRITDNDFSPSSNVPKAIAVSAVDNTHGTWQYAVMQQKGMQLNWVAFDFTGPNAGKALLLDSVDSIRFVPATDWNGTVSNGFTYHAWDKTNGSAGTYLTIDGNTGGNKTLSAASDKNTSIEVSAVNDAPTISGVPSNAPNVLIGTAEALADFTVGDVDNADTILTVTLTATNGSIGGLTDANEGAEGIQLTGKAADINTALADATFTATTVSTPTSISISVTDGTVTTPTTATYNLTAIDNRSPVITSGATATINVAEKRTAVTTVMATDADSDTLTYSISGGADSAKFSIVGTTGVLTFATAPNFEVPTDSDTNNTYVVEVQASDGNGGTDTQAITVTVTDVDETPPPAPTPTPTPDSDGVSDTVENATPGLPPSGSGAPVAGDGNGDGVKDSQQSNVTSVSFRETPTAVSSPGTAPTAFVSLVADSRAGKIDTTDSNSATLSNVRQLDAPANLPEGVNMPLGLISFSASVGRGTGGAAITETFSLYVDADLGVNGYWKQDNDGTWVNLASSVFSGATVQEGGKLRLDFAITDGGEFDADGKVDGVITDPGAAGSMPLSLVGYAPDLPQAGFWF